jgi:UDP-N-acetylglucosamine acyltransferase
LTGRTCIGAENEIHAGCIIGDAPQDIRYKGEPTRLLIGDRNVFREHMTVHRSKSLSEDTVIGSDNFLMAHSHVGHNVHLGNYVILANGALLAGHATVGDRAFISGNCLVHQFVRVGTLALMQGGSAVSKDLPPFTVARGDNGICGLNVVGLRRAGISSEERLELKRLYHLLFRSREKLRTVLLQAEQVFTGSLSRVLIEFVTSNKRGLCTDISKLSHPQIPEEVLPDPP